MFSTWFTARSPISPTAARRVSLPSRLPAVPPPSRPLRIITIQAACFRDPAVTRFDLLPWHRGCVLRARPSLGVLLYRQPIISMHPASVALLQSSLGLHSFLRWNCRHSPWDFAVQHSCVCVCVCYYPASISFICRIILKAHIYGF